MDNTAPNRNLFRGYCCYCWKTVRPGEGYREHSINGWRVIHVACNDKRAAGIPYEPTKRKTK